MIKPKENILRVIKREDPEWIPYGMEATITIVPPVVERPERAGRDAFGVKWSYCPQTEGGTYPAVNEHPLIDIYSWRENIRIPDLDNCDWESVRVKASEINRDEYLVQGFVEMGLFERTYLLMGMEEALVNYMLEPEEMKALLNTLADYKVELISRFDDAADLDIIWYGDDWGTQTNLFISAQTWRDIIKPPTKRIYDCMKERGIMINQHSCGKIEEVIPDIIEMGADMWNPCQPCNDLARLKREYGEVFSFCGGIDSQMILDREDVTEEEVRAEVKQRIDQLGKGGGYIAEPSHFVPFEPMVMDAMISEIRLRGKYR